MADSTNILTEYAGEFAYKLNKYLASNLSNDKRMNEKILLMETAFQNANIKYTKTLYRGKSMPPRGNNYEERNKCKEIFKSSFYISTTSNKIIAIDDFIGQNSNCCLYVINVSPDVKYIDMYQYSTKPVEYEILLDKNMYNNVYHIQNETIKYKKNIEKTLTVYYIYISKFKKDVNNENVISELKKLHKISKKSKKLCNNKNLINNDVVNKIKQFVADFNNRENVDATDYDMIPYYFNYNDSSHYKLLKKYLNEKHQIHLTKPNFKYLVDMNYI